MRTQSKFEKIVDLCLSRGFVIPSAEIYGGFAATYEYGPLGALLADNIRRIWKRELVRKLRNVLLFEGSIVTHPRVWEASGHVERFRDPVVHDTVTGARYRADHLVRDALDIDVANLTAEELEGQIRKHSIRSPAENELSNVSEESLLVKGRLAGREIFLRGETCQNIFVSFEQIVRAARQSVPFGILQIGRVFRDEVSGRQFILRTREFEQMEFEFFMDPEDPTDWYEYWKQKFQELLVHQLGLPPGALRCRLLSENEKPHYATHAADLEYLTSDGAWMELSPLNHRADWDLRRHSEFSKKDLKYFDTAKGRAFTPHVVETSFGVARLMYTVLDRHLKEEEVAGRESRSVLALPFELAPYQVALLPLSKKHELCEIGERLFAELSERFSCDIDESGSIGKRYRRQDEIGTPYCITIDFETLADKRVTVRSRDTMQQQRVALEGLLRFVTDDLDIRRKQSSGD